MTKRQYILFFIPALIWGSTWYAIKFQLGSVDPLQSITYRFLIAGVLLFLFCLLTRKNLKFTIIEHGMMALLGFCLFGFNYWCVYEAEIIFTSGFVSVIFSLIIFFNIFFNAIFLKGPIDKKMIYASILGVTGTYLLFINEFKVLDLDKQSYIGLIICFTGIILSSLGNILSAYKQKKNIPVIQANAFGMIYGSIFMFLIVLITGKTLAFDASIPYIGSLVYLSIFGSIGAFTLYLKLLGEIGPDKSIYITLITPAIALVISTIFEGYHWHLPAFAGLLFLAAGNFIVIRTKHSYPIKTK